MGRIGPTFVYSESVNYTCITLFCFVRGFCGTTTINIVDSVSCMSRNSRGTHVGQGGTTILTMLGNSLKIKHIEEIAGKRVPRELKELCER